MKSLLAMVWMVVFVAACSDPMDARVPVQDGKLAESEDFKAAVLKLSPDDQKNLAAYLVRASMVAGFTNTPMTSVTIAEALAAQKKSEAEEKVKAEKEAAEQAKLAAEEKAARDAHEANLKRVRDMVSGALVEKGFRPVDYQRGIVQEAILFSVLFVNKTDKAITGMKGSMVLDNTLGDNIGSFYISLEKDIPAKGEYMWSGGLHFNQFMDDHAAMKNAELAKIVSKWQPDMIMFEDGTVERME